MFYLPYICIKVQEKDVAFSKKYLAFNPSSVPKFRSDLTTLGVWVISTALGLRPKGGY